ncbi:hypothetical protein [Blastococcus haudaquaticus]|uniref:Uncharacterized protein n=1 Tax=Blastococcus haudaquaticus TaxID=1938745 RepID=A0A286GCU7_9ACTN|nr:hypothetical protein [Blastococcus haudaquaticus]SOD92949.1 hypothetical protein SAMN06272739_0089 [Blastococcus haudaquaticus]
MNAVEIRPGMPDMSYFKGTPDREPALRRCRLVVDRSAGTATWVGDGLRERRVDLTLGEGPGQLAELVRVVYPWFFLSDELAGRLLLVDSGGRVLARSMRASQRIFEQMWPFDVLDASGLPVREERFANSRRLQQAHRGAAPDWPITAGRGWMLLTSMSGAVLVVGLFALFVVLTGWSA